MMNFKLDSAGIFIPDGTSPETALARTTHMAIGAHQDDLEIMAIDGILKCFQLKDRWFTGVVVTNGSGSPREDLYRDYSDEEMQQVRAIEQKNAAVVGQYSAQVLLDYPSSAVKDGANKDPVNDIQQLLEVALPNTVYTHNLADKHATHVGVTLKVIEAIRSLPAANQPQQVFGCEVWRDLDWMVDDDKVAFDCTAHENLQAALLGVFDSQICGGKRYDLATIGRRRANATYFASHDVDISTGMAFGMDLMPLIQEPNLDIITYVQSFIDRFATDVHGLISKLQE